MGLFSYITISQTIWFGCSKKLSHQKISFEFNKCFGWEIRILRIIPLLYAGLSFELTVHAWNPVQFLVFHLNLIVLHCSVCLNSNSCGETWYMNYTVCTKNDRISELNHIYLKWRLFWTAEYLPTKTEEYAMFSELHQFTKQKKCHAIWTSIFTTKRLSCYLNCTIFTHRNTMLSELHLIYQQNYHIWTAPYLMHFLFPSLYLPQKTVTCYLNCTIFNSCSLFFPIFTTKDCNLLSELHHI